MKKIAQTAVFAAALLIMNIPVAAAAPSVDEIVNKANLASYYAGDDGKSQVTMTITDGQGRVRNRQFVILRKDVKNGGDQNMYVYFHRPSDVRKMVYLVHKHMDRDDDRWMYLPRLDLVKRIAASDKRTSFVGSHFYYEDVSGRDIHADKHVLKKETDEFYVLHNTPKNTDEVEFKFYDIWIDKKNFIPMKAEYTNTAGNKYRIVEALEVKDIQGLPTVVKSRVRDLESGGDTVSEFNDIQYNIGLNERIFTERYLRRPPREVRR